ncbi:hypothetical protein SAMN05660745_02352 [Corynebacterium glucuronolyticum]|nr:hypothetical protein CGLUCO_05420 [Corynebacterium glucuronolyticum DSM 44120]SMB80083.1 hypothetical protein SAMN05660745_02352 [Corynebacterium glucuronolyticum]
MFAPKIYPCTPYYPRITPHEADVLHMHTTGTKYKISSAAVQIGAQVCTTPLKAPQCIFAHTLNSGG